MDVSSLLRDLNKQQRAAVCASDCNALVLAGAGSGKTRVLVHRLAWLIHVDKVLPHSILALTFTNKAAREMRGRIETMLKRGLGGVWCGTFHAIANRILHIHYKDAGLRSDFAISDHADQLQFIKRVLKTVDIDPNKINPQSIRSVINRWKESGWRSNQVPVAENYIQDRILTVYNLYEKIAREESMVDFPELLLRLYELLRDDEKIAEHYRNRFRHILVDEFQDTNQIQYAVIRLLQNTRRPNYVMAVGDEDQSIYSWRGADVSNLLNFSKLFAPVEIFPLEQNYRSTKQILLAANSLIDHNKERLGKRLWTQNQDEQPIDFYRASHDANEALYVVDNILEHLRAGGALSDCAVLYRVNAQSRLLEETLTHSKLPYRIYGGLRFYDRAEIRNALAYMHLTVNRDDTQSFVRALNLPPRGLGAITLERIAACAAQNAISYWQAAEMLVADHTLPTRTAAPLRQFMQLIDNMEAKTQNLSMQEKSAYIIKMSGLLEYYENLKKEEGATRLENLKELINAAGMINGEEGEDAMLAFLNTVALEAGGDKEDAEYKDAVQLMTLHAAKGLEFPIVFMVGMEEGIFPHENSAGSEEQLEEERRLCYVGITRTMRHLHLVCCEIRNLYGRASYNPLSRFVEEIPPELIRDRGASLNQDAKIEVPRLKKGQRVLHPTFGYGIVRDMEGRGEHARVEVDFETEGNKWLVLRYAEIQML